LSGAAAVVRRFAVCVRTVAVTLAVAVTVALALAVTLTFTLAVTFTFTFTLTFTFAFTFTFTFTFTFAFALALAHQEALLSGHRRRLRALRVAVGRITTAPFVVAGVETAGCRCGRR